MPSASNLLPKNHRKETTNAGIRITSDERENGGRNLK